MLMANLLIVNFVDLPGIGPGPQQCECRVIPFYYRPSINYQFSIFNQFSNSKIFNF